ncbi:DnaB-like helicase C-terminal domain-containing protein [Desulfosediminicola flagellatus]|uniref:DnaB-like helicase C-terminal domain-containing protein n=1 Tax=Desulfosediminicola flagellatus TaxID=2569541 RepID=UPI0010AB623B|nr:DnaB-like helicase C-terminal domain-containing protein [Desulfosediminicola flagellatus]
MPHPDDAVSLFYLKHLNGVWQDKGVYTAECPFCRDHGVTSPGKLVVILNPDGFFHGYFRCLSRCTAGGFALRFGTLLNIDLAEVPGYDPDLDSPLNPADYPVSNHNGEMRACHDRLPDDVLTLFAKMHVGRDVLAQMQIGFNGRYITYPYVQADGNCYSLRCVFPDRPEDFFWQGDEHFSVDPYRIFNVQEIERCHGGTLFLCDGEESVLVLKNLGYPGVAVPQYQAFEAIDPEQFRDIHTLFIVARNSAESLGAAKDLAARIGYKVRILSWPAGTARNVGLADLAIEYGKEIRKVVGRMIRSSSAFSPFASPEREYLHFLQTLSGKQENAYNELRTGFPLLDLSLDGVHGINVIGGAPKVGKSAFTIQIASQMAEKGIPVLYYDFENGRQQVYQRILSRLSRIEVKQLGSGNLTDDENQRYEASCGKLKKMMQNFRVVNDRKLTPDLMRRHIDFIRHETRSQYTVVIVDSLHKLPFKEFSERRTGIDAWLRQMESIRDELQVSFLVISELTRGTAEKAYAETPHLGVFKGSGDIEYSADNAMVLFADNDQDDGNESRGRQSTLWIVASREHRPGPVARYMLDYPYWGFIEQPFTNIDPVVT